MIALLLSLLSSALPTCDVPTAHLQPGQTVLLCVDPIARDTIQVERTHRPTTIDGTYFVDVYHLSYMDGDSRALAVGVQTRDGTRAHELEYLDRSASSFVFRRASMIPGDYGYHPGQEYDTARFEREISRPAPRHPARCPVWMRLRSGRIIGALSSDPRHYLDGRINTVPAPKNWGRKPTTKKQEN